MIIAALLSLPLLPGGTVFGQTAPGPQTAAVEASTPTAAAAALRPGDITREQYLQRAQERAAQRAAARFDQMDSNHDGVLDRSERRAWRSQHARRPAAQ
jgi:exonuclease VII large subunit